jgi:hypothetical protein
VYRNFYQLSKCPTTGDSRHRDHYAVEENEADRHVRHETRPSGHGTVSQPRVAKPLRNVGRNNKTSKEQKKDGKEEEETMAEFIK